MDTIFGNSEKSKEFNARVPEFLPAFHRLDDLAKTIFDRKTPFADLSEQVCFGLGRACWEEFYAITCSSLNGYEHGALQMVRGYYERGLALAYISLHPEKAERFVQFDVIRDYRTMNSALKGFTEKWYNRALHLGDFVHKTRERYTAIEAVRSKLRELWDEKARNELGY